jgi:hypothetical protein
VFRTHLHPNRASSRLRRPATVACGLAAAGILLAGLAALAPAGAATSGPEAPDAAGQPTIYEQQAVNQDLAIATGNVHTTVSASPVLAKGDYLVNLAMSVDSIPPGAVVLCGFATTTASDVGDGNYGLIRNGGTAASGGTCDATGTMKINDANDRIITWATVIVGPAGAGVGSWSANDTPVGKIVLN